MLTRLRARLLRRNTRRRVFRTGLVLLNLALVAGVVTVVLLNPAKTSGTPSPIAGSAEAAATGPVDQLASVNIAVTAARMANLPEAAAVTNQADSATIELSLASTNSTVANKPQSVTSTFISNKDIQTYIAKAGDSISSVASRFSVSSDSILWSNGLTANTLTAGQHLLIPPVNGIVYTVRAGDTPATLASTYHSSESKIILYNDAEIGGLKVGERIIIPNGTISVAPVYSYNSVGASGFAWGSSAIYGSNGYDFGECTWYVATQIPVPANWGNAATWAAGARASGWRVSSVPTVGAIAQTPYAAGGLGHVAIVDGVSSDGTKVLIRDMNGIAGWDRVGTAWEPTSEYPNYITR